ncbi:MAG: MFS transporter [Deltaproteobacteria bacterium]|nr:MFS transporter [Deltaproteobacteria bacterium]
MSADTPIKTPKFAGIGILPGLTRTNYFFLFFNTFIVGMFMSIPAILQPAFMNDVINIDQKFAGSINGFLQNMSQVATLAFVALICALSDRVGRKILILIGFIVLAVSFYGFKLSSGIAQGLGIDPDFAASLCAALSFVPGQAAEFTAFAPGLLVAYFMRFMVGIGLILAFPQFITMVGDYTRDKERGKGMALNGMSIGLASIFVFGTFGTIVRQNGVAAGFNTAILIAAIGAILTALFIKDCMPEAASEKKGFFDIIPLVRGSIALKAAYITTLITRADTVILATFIVTWGVTTATISSDIRPEHVKPAIIEKIYAQDSPVAAFLQARLALTPAAQVDASFTHKLSTFITTDDGIEFAALFNDRQDLAPETQQLLDKPARDRTEQSRLNRLLVKEAFPEEITKTIDELRFDSGVGTLMASIPVIIMGIASLLAFPFVGVMLEKKGRMATMIPCMMCAAAGMFAISLSPDPFHWLAYLGGALIGIGMSGSVAGANTLAVDASPIDRLGAVMGGLNTMQPIGILLFLGLGGVLFDTVAPGAPFALKGLATLVLVAWLIAVRNGVTREIKPLFGMDWEEAAQALMMRIPGGVRQGAIEGTEAYAKDQGLSIVTVALCQELRKMMDEAEGA